jgi:hypothetical protein
MVKGSGVCGNSKGCPGGFATIFQEFVRRGWLCSPCDKAKPEKEQELVALMRTYLATTSNEITLLPDPTGNSSILNIA